MRSQRSSGWLVSDAVVVGGGSGDISRLTRRHGVKVGARSLYTVEEVALAVGEVIGHGSMKSAAWMNGAIVFFCGEGGAGEPAGGCWYQCRWKVLSRNF
ncbi:hypothetical protein D4764_05G0010680 [Takifugu flavidus]|uniref:Uncharacterized protein n=1 Tax=Takifugu flavidus TaxID=433684 RepID=A0A5C6N2I7_9TELE|nr:hypothetical protein D4764_05G0010680 [Takifugu flavidus]